MSLVTVPFAQRYAGWPTPLPEISGTTQLPAKGGAVDEAVSVGEAASSKPERSDASGVNGKPELAEAALEATATLVPLTTEVVEDDEGLRLEPFGAAGSMKEDRGWTRARPSRSHATCRQWQ